ncbi:hypothetical protein KSP40_PGU007211 [Platanthera guangdongensis]|uniref:Uncharacterized protein n=1 Tax=Platanthera guangdongensis TaxID=2320717 RepID=A0ABR2LUJ2_9ASPA
MNFPHLLSSIFPDTNAMISIISVLVLFIGTIELVSSRQKRTGHGAFLTLIRQASNSPRQKNIILLLFGHLSVFNHLRNDDKIGKRILFTKNDQKRWSKAVVSGVYVSSMAVHSFKIRDPLHSKSLTRGAQTCSLLSPLPDPSNRSDDRNPSPHNTFSIGISSPWKYYSSNSANLRCSLSHRQNFCIAEVLSPRLYPCCIVVRSIARKRQETVSSL